jgi:hypothetical protein
MGKHLYLPMELIDVDLLIEYQAWFFCCFTAGLLYAAHKRGIL